MFRRARVLIRMATQEHKLSSKCYIFCLFIWFSLPTFLHNVSAFVHMFLFQKLTTNKSMKEKRKKMLVQHNKSFSKELIFSLFPFVLLLIFSTFPIMTSRFLFTLNTRIRTCTYFLRSFVTVSFGFVGIAKKQEALLSSR